MFRKAILIIICILNITILLSIEMNLPANSVLNASSNLIFLCDSPGNYSVNPAFCFNGLEAGYSNLFQISDLPLYNFHFGKKLKLFRFSAGESHLSHPFYKESNSHFAISSHYKNLLFGISFNYIFNEVVNYNANTAFVIDGGFILETEKSTVSFAIKNISKSKVTDIDLPIIIFWETMYKISEKTKVSLGLEKETDFDFSFKIGGSQTLYDILTIISSYQYNPDRISGGVKISVKNIATTYSIKTHQYLDLTHYITVCYEY